MHLPRLGRPRKPTREPMAQVHPHPLMQAHWDGSLPYWVASDHAIWGTFDNIEDAVALADEVAKTQPMGERILVTYFGIGSYTTTGHNRATTRPTSGAGVML
jgi:hypothetical protein